MRAPAVEIPEAPASRRYLRDRGHNLRRHGGLQFGQQPVGGAPPLVSTVPVVPEVARVSADDDIGQEPPGNGDLFDVAVDQAGSGILFVNDGTNTLELLH